MGFGFGEGFEVLDMIMGGWIGRLSVEGVVKETGRDGGCWRGREGMVKGKDGLWGLSYTGKFGSST